MDALLSSLVLCCLSISLVLCCLIICSDAYILTFSRIWLLVSATVSFTNSRINGLLGNATVSIFTISRLWLLGSAKAIALYSRSHFSISRLWCPTQLGFNVIPIGLYQQFGPSTVSSIPSPIQLTFGAAAVLSILSPIRLYHDCGAATMSSPLSHSHLFFPTPSCGATNTPPLYSQSRSLWARPLNILMDLQERSLAN